MAQIQKLKDRKSGATIYPVTSFGAVYDNDGRDLETRLASERGATEAALQGKAPMAALEGKQDRLGDSADIVLPGDGGLALTRAARLRLFNDQWNTAWGDYGCYDPDNAPDPEHPYMGNDLWMTYEEAVEIMNVYRTVLTYPYNYAFAQLQVRTLAPVHVVAQSSMTYMFQGCTQLKIIRIEGANYNKEVRPSEAGWMFDGCRSLHTIDGIIDLGSTTNVNLMFRGCVSLVSVLLKNLRQSISLSDSPLLSLDSISYMIANAVNTSAITITVHADVYGKITDEGNAEWFALLGKAVAKNISFATV